MNETKEKDEPEEPCCGNCPAFEPTGVDDRRKVLDSERKGPLRGECRLGPPAMMCLGADSERNPIVTGVRPIVGVADFCMHHPDLADEMDPYAEADDEESEEEGESEEEEEEEERS